MNKTGLIPITYRRGVIPRLFAMAAISLTLMLHILFIKSLVFFSTGMRSFKPGKFSSYGSHKVYYLSVFLFFLMAIYPLYRKERIKKISKLYSKKYTNATKLKRLKKIYLFIVAPTVFAVIMNNWTDIVTFVMHVLR